MSPAGIQVVSPSATRSFQKLTGDDIAADTRIDRLRIQSSLKAAGLDQSGQCVAHGAVADQVGRWRRVKQGERLYEHVGCLVIPEPAGEGEPRRGQARQWPGRQALHC